MPMPWLDDDSQRYDEASDETTSRYLVPSNNKKQDKGSEIPSQISNDNDDDDGGDDNDGFDGDDGGFGGSVGGGGNYGSETLGDMSWAQGNDNYYVTQDTYHGYRPGIDSHRRHLAQLTEYPSSDECGYLSYPQGYWGLGYEIEQLGLGNETHTYNVANYGDTYRHSFFTDGYGQHHASNGESDVGPTQLPRSFSTSTSEYHNSGAVGGGYYGYGDRSSSTSSYNYQPRESTSDRSSYPSSNPPKNYPPNYYTYDQYHTWRN